MKTDARKPTKTGMSREERGARTRKQLLEATIECLAELGYAGMSTNDVVNRTGVSRGALAHHFPSKAQLVAEAAVYLIDKRIKYTIRKIKALENNNGDLRQQIEAKWRAYEKWFPANIEFMVAARTDARLRKHFTRAMDQSEKELIELQEESFTQSQLTNYVTGCFIRGLCLERLVNPPELIDRIFDEFVRIMEAVVAAEKSDP